MRQWIREYRATLKRRKLMRELRALVTLGDCADSRRRAVARELTGNFVFCSGAVDALGPDVGNRRFMVLK